MNRRTWWSIAHGVAKCLEMTEWLNSHNTVLYDDTRCPYLISYFSLDIVHLGQYFLLCLVVYILFSSFIFT